MQIVPRSLVVGAFAGVGAWSAADVVARVVPAPVDEVVYVVADFARKSLAANSIVLVRTPGCRYNDSLVCITERPVQKDSEQVAKVLSRLPSAFAQQNVMVDIVPSADSAAIHSLIMNNAKSVNPVERSLALIAVSPAWPTQSKLAALQGVFTVQVSVLRIERGCHQCAAEMDVTELAWRSDEPERYTPRVITRGFPVSLKWKDRNGKLGILPLSLIGALAKR